MWLPIVTNIIGSIIFCFPVEPVINKARNTVTDKLKDGDIVDEKLREKIIQDLDDIKKKIDGLARKDLLASYRFFKEGVVTLNLAIDEANGAQNGGSNTTATTTRSKSESGVLNEAIALTQAIQKLSQTSNGPFLSAERCFRDARREATRAFSNEALSLPDRIMAAQLRVVSKILECLQDTKTAVAGCMLFLEELHKLPAVGETFSTYFKGGLKSRFYKDSRLENVKSVLSLNFAISEFVSRFSGQLLNVRNWPRIHTTGEPIHPLLLDIDVVKEIFDKEEFQMPGNHVILSGRKFHRLYSFCVNSKGQILWLDSVIDCINMLNRSGDIETFCDFRKVTAILEGTFLKVKALAIDRHDYVFVIVTIDFEDNSGIKFVLFGFDSSGNEQCEGVLEFLGDCEGVLEFLEDCVVKCVVNSDGDVIIGVFGGKNLYVCDIWGNLKSRLPISERGADLECVTDQDEIVMRTYSDVLVYTKEGELKRTITVKNFIESATFNNITSKTEVVVESNSIFRWPSYSILSYSENGEFECLYLPVKRYGYGAKFFSHPAGPAAFVFFENETCKVVFM